MYRGFGASFMGFIGFGIYFCIEKSVDRVYGSYGPAVSRSTVDRPWEGGRSSPSAPVLWGTGDCCESLGRERVTPQSSPRSELGGAVAESCERRRGLVAVVEARWARPFEQGEDGMTMGTSCGGGGRGVVPFYRVGEVVEGSGGGRPMRWVLTPPVSKVLKGGVGDSTGSRLDEGRGRGGSAARLLMVHRRGAGHNGGDRTNG
jgi:hypothetical protein